MEKATIYDYARMCRKFKECSLCPVSNHNSGLNCSCYALIEKYPDKANEIILKWCKEHPAETRQSKLLKMFLNASVTDDALDICPQRVDKNMGCHLFSCSNCKREYWLAEAEENE